MTPEGYQRGRARLLEVLRDAVERGDIYLEYDVKEMLENLKERYNEEEDES